MNQNPPLCKQSGHWLVVSDLDGTLLDHYTYSHSAVDGVLKQLKLLSIPVILNSSKTVEEMLKLRESFDNLHPFIVENGSAIYIPIDYFSRLSDDVVVFGDYCVITLGATRETIQTFLDLDAQEYGTAYLSFAKSTITEIVEYTGLSVENAQQASQRLYSEPLLWRGDDKEKQDFIRRVNAAGLNTLQGGRFLHVLGDSDKGRATTYLQKLYERQHQRNYQLLAAGDSPNDLAMLAVADIALIVRSPTQAPPTLPGHACAYVSQAEGPSGWSEIVSPLLVGE